jgi:hypothetical protein
VQSATRDSQPGGAVDKPLNNLRMATRFLGFCKPFVTMRGHGGLPESDTGHRSRSLRAHGCTLSSPAMAIMKCTLTATGSLKCGAAPTTSGFINVLTDWGVSREKISKSEKARQSFPLNQLSRGVTIKTPEISHWPETVSLTAIRLGRRQRRSRVGVTRRNRGQVSKVTPLKKSDSSKPNFERNCPLIRFMIRSPRIYGKFRLLKHHLMF